MLKELMEPFAAMFEDKGDELILENYTLKDGTYILVNLGSMDIENVITIDKKTDMKNILDKNLLKACDYYSSLIDMNKPMDPKKVIHSNQLYAFHIKQNVINEKLTGKILEGYRANIMNPLNKYKKGEAKRLYENIAKELPEINEEDADKIFNWIAENIHNLDCVDYENKNYLKIFFVQDDYKDNASEKTREVFKTEYKRYVIPNIYNSNDYNREVEGTIYGLPNNCMGLNSKKPFLANLSRKVEEPYMLDSDTVLLQKSLFDYLLNLAKENKRIVYINDREINGITTNDTPDSKFPIKYDYIMNISYAKDVEIKNFENLTIKENLDYEVEVEKYLSKKKDGLDYEIIIGGSLFESIDKTFFYNRLGYNLFLDDGEVDIKEADLKQLVLNYKDSIYRYKYLNDDFEISRNIRTIYKSAIELTLARGNFFKAREQFDLGTALEKHLTGGSVMEELKTVSEIFTEHCKATIAKEDWKIETDEEYFYAIGQILGFINGKRQAKDKTAAFVNNICNCRKHDLLKNRLFNLIQKHDNYIDTYNLRLTKAIAKVLEYKPKSEIPETMMIFCGFLDSNEFFKKIEK